MPRRLRGPRALRSRPRCRALLLALVLVGAGGPARRRGRSRSLGEGAAARRPRRATRCTSLLLAGDRRRCWRRPPRPSSSTAAARSPSRLGGGRRAARHARLRGAGHGRRRRGLHRRWRGWTAGIATARCSARLGLLFTGTVVGLVVAYVVRFQALALLRRRRRACARIDPALDDAARSPRRRPPTACSPTSTCRCCGRASSPPRCSCSSR